MDDYQLIWQISAEHQQFGNGFLFRIYLGAGITILGVIGIGLKLFTNLLPRKATFSAYFATLFGLIWTTLHWNVMSAEKLETDRLAAMLSSQQHETVQGVVKVLHQQPVSGHSQGDIVEIAGKKIEINFYTITPGYRNTIANGGVLADGVEARVRYVNDVILSVEIK